MIIGRSISPPSKRMLSASVAILIVVIFSSCSDSDKTPDVVKFENSRLHLQGTHCENDYFAINDGNFVYSNGGSVQVIQKGVEIKDLGSDRLAMVGQKGIFKLVTIFSLNNNKNIAKIESYKLAPEPTKEQWSIMSGAGVTEEKFNSVAREMVASPPMELCPALRPSKP